MIEKQERERIIRLVKREVVPAIGCTEPIAVALCTARCADILGCVPERVDVRLSANILKNAMGVGIPGTGMIGLPIAVALGATMGKHELALQVLRDVTPGDVERGKEFIDQGRINISLKEGITEKLYIEVECFAGRDSALAVISGGHTNWVLLQRNSLTLLDNRLPAATEESAEADPELTLQKVWDFATTAPMEEIDFILETRNLNKEAASVSLNGHYGHQVGRTMRSFLQNRVMGDSIFSHMLSYTAAACDARMAGACVPVMSNSGSGNQGIAATLPVVVFAEDTAATPEQLTRALMLSHLTAIYIKQSLGRLSALCGCVVAATGSSCGITYLMGGGYRQVAAAVKNMIANLTGMICDGAKPSCAMKLTSGVSTAVISAIMAMDDHVVSSVEGIIDDDVDKSIRNFSAIGRDGMNETDRLVLGIMTSK